MSSKKQRRQQQQLQAQQELSSFVQTASRHHQQVVYIWDRDWYYRKKYSTVLPNADARLLSSYYKQLGSKVVFIADEADIQHAKRCKDGGAAGNSIDLIYLIRNSWKTPGPPVQLIKMSNVNYLGKGWPTKAPEKLFKLTSIRLACRPDYRLYPNRLESRLTRSNHIHLLDSTGQRLLPLTQDIENAFTNKYTIVDDDRLWDAPLNELLAALQRLSKYKHIRFENPVALQKLLPYNGDNNLTPLQAAFFKLNLISGSKLDWFAVPFPQIEEAISFWRRCKEVWPNTAIGPLRVEFDRPYGQVDQQWYIFQQLCSLLTSTKRRKIPVIIERLASYEKAVSPIRFRELSWFSISCPKVSWLEYLVRRYLNQDLLDLYSGEVIQQYLSSPIKWPPEFRSLLRQTYEMSDFCLTRWGDSRLPDDVIPWPLLKKEFKYGL